MAIEGSYSRADIAPSGQHDLTLALNGTRWPWTLANSLVQASGELTGNLDGQDSAPARAISTAMRPSRTWSRSAMLFHPTRFTSRPRALNWPRGKQRLLDHRQARCDEPGAFRFRVRARSPPSPRRGVAGGDGRSGRRGQAIAGDFAPTRRPARRARKRPCFAPTSGRAATDTPRNGLSPGKSPTWRRDWAKKSLTLSEPATLVAKFERHDTATKLERLDIQSSFLTATGQGDVDRGIVVTATLDLAAFRERFRDWIDLGEVDLAGQGKLEATLSATGRRLSGRHRRGISRSAVGRPAGGREVPA